jgi:hypothetical protein
MSRNLHTVPSSPPKLLDLEGALGHVSQQYKNENFESQDKKEGYYGKEASWIFEVPWASLSNTYSHVGHFIHGGLRPTECLEESRELAVLSWKLRTAGCDNLGLCLFVRVCLVLSSS